MAHVVVYRACASARNRANCRSFSTPGESTDRSSARRANSDSPDSPGAAMTAITPIIISPAIPAIVNPVMIIDLLNADWLIFRRVIDGRLEVNEIRRSGCGCGGNQTGNGK